MSQATICLIFAMAFFVALVRGVGWAFALVYIPALILFNQVPELTLPHVPLKAQFAPIYAILLAMPFRHESLRFRWCAVDTIIVLLLTSSTITGWTTGEFETGINSFRQELTIWVAPYFLARMVFHKWETRRLALYVMIGLIAILSVLALIEFRLTPYFYLHVLQNIGMGNPIHSMAYIRYGFFRVSGTVEHPIYFGNMCVVLLGMTAVLARTSGMRLLNPWVALALFGAAGCVITSISFTPYVAMTAGSVFFLILIAMPYARKLLVPLVLVVITGVFAFTYHAANTKLGDKPEGDLPGSFWTRKLIITESWKKAVTAGPFGYGRWLDFSDDDFDLTSVDNSYMLFTMSYGWVYTTLWVSIAVFFAIRMTIAFNHVRHRSQVFPLAVATATVLGLMVSMYTVWAGGEYRVVWAIMLGLTNTLIDSVLETSPSQASRAVASRRVVPVRSTVVGGPPIPGPAAFSPQPRMHIAEGG
jgi:hypothetical protein